VLLAAVRVASTLRYRRRRGRWGLLQDRFSALAPIDAGTPPTNPARAEQVAEHRGQPDHEHGSRIAGTVADALDRVAFDPSWVDDDETFERTRTAVAMLERRPR
jgi:hypothetical protein